MTTKLYWNIVVAVFLVIAFWWHITRKPKRHDLIYECTQQYFKLRKELLNCKVEQLGSYNDMIIEFEVKWGGKDTAGVASDHAVELRKILGDLVEEMVTV